MARVGDKGTVVSISGKEETKRFLAGLGFTPGTEVKAVSEASDPRCQGLQDSH